MGEANRHFKTLIRRRDFLNERIKKAPNPETSFLVAERNALNWFLDDYVSLLKNKDFYEYAPKRLQEDFEKRNSDDESTKRSTELN